ncbi:MAG: hypothetical protein ACRD18_08435 [Terriglobia bacterium]
MAAIDLTVTASATYAAGSDHETGTGTLEALGPERSRVILNLDGGRREEIRNGFAGAWVGADGAAHAAALHNCWTDASWFTPLLTLEAASSDPTISVTLAESSHSPRKVVTPGESGGGNPSAVEELVLSRIVANQSAAITAEIQKLSTMNLYLDSSSLLPVELDFNIHPDKDASRDIPVEIEFSDYRTVSGVRVPFHIRKYVQHSLLLDLQVSVVTVNSGVAASDFAIPAAVAPTGGQQ